MKKLAFISGLLFVIVYFGVNTLSSEKSSFEKVYPAISANSLPDEVKINKNSSPLVAGKDIINSSEEGYYLILASFNDITQAQQMAERYVNNYNTDIFVLPPTAEGYYRICCGRYSAPDEAGTALAGVRQTISPNAWILSIRE